MLEAGMDDHLAKPLRAEDLAEVLGRRLPAGTVPRTVRIVAPATRAASGPGAGGSSILDEEAFGRLVGLGDARLVERVVARASSQTRRSASPRSTRRSWIATRPPAVALDALEAICGTVGAAALGRRTRSLRDELRRGRTRSARAASGRCSTRLGSRSSDRLAAARD